MRNEKRTEQVIVNKPHDKGYKRDLRNPKEFLHFLKKYVGADWAKELEVSQLHLCDKEFIGKDYEGKEADLVYEITLKNEERIFVFILQELQSTVDYTMIFRIVMYILGIMSDYFLSIDKNQREQAGFRLPAVVPVVFYNGADRWTAIQDFREYQIAGNLFGEYILGLRYHLVDLNGIEEDYILATNTVIDNIMYCDKFRRKTEVAEAVRTSLQRVRQLGNQELEEFKGWVKNILLTICRNQESEVMEILNWAESGENDMAFKYNIIKAWEDDQEDARAEGQLLKLIFLLRKKYQKGKTVSEAANDLEEDVSDIQVFYDLIAQYPNEDDEKILARYLKQ